MADCSSVKFSPQRLQKIASGAVGAPHLVHVVDRGSSVSVGASKALKIVRRHAVSSNRDDDSRDLRVGQTLIE